MSTGLDAKVGGTALCRSTCIEPYTLTRGKRYEILEVNPLYRAPGILGNVLFTIKDDKNRLSDVPSLNFSEWNP